MDELIKNRILRCVIMLMSTDIGSPSIQRELLMAKWLREKFFDEYYEIYAILKGIKS